MKKFIGRVEQKNAFEDSLSLILPDSKKGIFSKKEKQPGAPQSASRLFLFYGEGGLGKTTLLDECIRTAEEKAKKNKQEVKIIKLDWDDCYNKRNFLPENIFGIITELHAGFSEVLPADNGYFEEFSKQAADISAAGRKDDEKANLGLLKSLSEAVVEFSGDYPLLLAIDAYERIDTKNVDHWFRGIFLKTILESSGRIIVILSGRNNHVEPYKNQFPGGIVHHAFFDELLFTITEIKDYTRACGLKFKDKDLQKLLRFSLGIPLVLVEVCSLINDGLTLNQALGGIIATKQTRTVIQDTVKASLKHCDPRDSERLLNIAMLRQCNPEILAYAWNLSPKETSNYLTSISGRRSFMRRGKIHPRVQEYLRSYIIDELAPENPIMLKRFGKKCRDFFAPKLEEIEKKETNIETLYSRDDFAIILLDYINALMWWDSGEAMDILDKHFLGLLEFQPDVIPRLNKILFEFDSLMTPGQKKNVDTLVTVFLDDRVNAESPYRPPGKSEAELLETLSSHKNVFDSMQTQLLNLKWGEIYFRSQEYEAAVRMFDLAGELVENSAAVKKKVLYIYRAMAENLSAKKEFLPALEYIERALRIEPGDIDVLYSRGDILLAHGQAGKALEDYNRIIELAPGEERAYARRGGLYEMQKETGKALTDYSRAIELGIVDAEIYSKRGFIYHFQSKYDNALSDYNRALEIEPENARIYYNRGALYHIKGNYKQAVVDCTLAVELDLEDVGVYLVRGRSSHALGDHEQALADYNRVIESGGPGADRVYYYRGDLCHALGDHESALSDYGRAIESDPGYADTVDGRGNDYRSKEEYEAELLEISGDIEACPEDAGLYYNRGNVYDVLGEYDRALLDYDEAIELDPGDPDFFNARGTLYQVRGEYRSALVDYNWAIELDSEDTGFYYNRGNTHDALGEYGKALADYGRAIELDPKNADAYNNRGTVHYQKGNYKEALADYTRSIEINPEDAGAYYNRGQVYDALKESENALSDYEKTISLNAEETTAYFLIVQVYIVSGKFTDALKTMDRIHSLKLEIDEGACSLYFDYIIRHMLDMETGTCEIGLDVVLEKEFVCTWSFDSIESWLSRVEIDAEKKTAIAAKTGLLKNHKT